MQSLSRPSFNNFAIFIGFLCLSVIAGGCADLLRFQISEEADSHLLSLDFSIESPAMTRADALPHESEIKDVYLLLFKDSDDESQSVWLGYVKGNVSPEDASRMLFPVPGFLSHDTPYRVLALANADRFRPEGFDNFALYLDDLFADSDTMSESEVRSAVKIWSDAAIVYTTDNDSFCLPMEGNVLPDANGISALRFRREGKGFTADGCLRFRRSVVRLDVINDAVDNFHLVGCAACNRRTGCRPFDPAYTCGSIAGLPDDKDYAAMDIDGSEGLQQRLEGRLYAFPNSSAVNSADDLESTGVILKGYYIDNGVTDSELCYYRVNLGVLGKGQILSPNSLWRIAISQVKGRGKKSAEEAYQDSGDLVVLSSGNGWNEPGIGYDMDDNGNFIAVSQPRISFPKNGGSAVRVMVLASEKVDWKVESDQDTAYWLQIDKGSNYIDVVPSGPNDTETERTAVLRISGEAAGSESRLCVGISVEQSGSPGGIEDWEFPPVALVPVTDMTENKYAGHVTVAHDPNDDGSYTIEIDGFEPDIFNSFMDLKFRLHVDANLGDGVTVNFATNMEWPMEGCVSGMPAGNLKYSWDSFDVYNTNSKKIVPDRPGPLPSNLRDGDYVYVSVGTMAPDDPAIIRSLTLTAGNGEITRYNICIKPRPVIIDDVIIRMDDGRHIMVCDRNVQDYFSKLYQFTAWRSDGYREKQAYHYASYEKMRIPNKVDQLGNQASENIHRSFGGEAFISSAADNPLFNNHVKEEWYLYNKSDDCKLSPFYSTSKIEEWGLPTAQELTEIFKELRISKMRTFFVSDIKTSENLEICNYIPFVFNKSSDYPDISKSNYYMISANLSDCKGIKLYFTDDGNLVISGTYNSGSSFTNVWLGRYIRFLTPEDLEMYRNNYLGYGEGKTSPLRPCIPDTWPHKSPYE